MAPSQNGRPLVLFVTSVFPPARVPEADHSIHQCLNLAERGYDVHVLTTRQKGIAEHETITVHPVMDTWGWSELPRVWSLLRRIRPDVTILFFLGTLFSYRTLPTFVPLLARLSRRGMLAITQFSNFGAGGREADRLRRTAFRLLGRFRYGPILPMSHGFIVLSEVHADRLESLDPRTARKTRVVPPPPLLPMAKDRAEARRRGRRALGVDADETVVGFYGRLYPNKGLEELIEATAALRGDFPRLRLVLIGGFLSAAHYWNTSEDYESVLSRFIEERGLEDFVVRTGEYRWDSFEASEYLFATDVCVLPLKAGVYLYNSSLAGVCAHRLPVIISRGSKVESPLRDRENVWVLPEVNAHRITEALHRVLTDELARARLTEGSARLAEEWFTWSSALTRMEELFASLRNTTSGAASLENGRNRSLAERTSAVSPYDS